MRAPSLSLTRPLLAWLREDPAWAGQDWRLRALLAWRAGLGSLNSSLSAQQPAAARLTRPLFIVGPWRSGSTVMHELLHAALGWPTPLSWQCMDPTAFRLQRAPRASVAVARPMDGLQLGALSPQEDEFALLALGVDSAYRAFWMPQRLDALQHTLDPEHWRRERGWLEVWEGFASAVQGSAERLLLKSPNHSFRLTALLERFPDAQLIWMLRDGAAVFASNRKMWGQMFATHGLGTVQPGALDRFLALALERCAELLERLQLPTTQLAFCWQERLQTAPQAELSRLLAQLGLNAQADERPLQQALQRVAKGRVERYAPLPDLSSQVAAAIARFDAAQRRVFQPAI